MPITHIPPKDWYGRTDPEDGPTAKRMHHYVGDDGHTAILGFACEEGVRRNQGRLGAKQAPAAIRKALSNLAAPKNMRPFTDLGDIAVDGDDLEAGQEALAEKIDSALLAHDHVIVLGGGHETAYGCYLGLRRHYPDQRIGIINLDAHFDIRNIGDEGPSSGTPFHQIHALEPEHFDYICIGVAEEANTQALFKRADKWDVRYVMDREIINNANAADQSILAMADCCDIIYLTIDLDLLPHYQAPGVSAPAARGVPFSTVEQLIQTVRQACREKACLLPLVDIVELSPPHDRDHMTARTAAYLVRQVLAG